MNLLPPNFTLNFIQHSSKGTFKLSKSVKSNHEHETEKKEKKITVTRVHCQNITEERNKLNRTPHKMIDSFYKEKNYIGL